MIWENLNKSCMVINSKESAGDGTTTATILAQKMVQEGLKNIASGANPMELKKGMEAGLAFVLEKLSSKSISLNGSDIQKVSTVSAGGDEEIGSIISKAMDIVTSDGVITVEESQSLETELDITEGMSFDRGYSSPYFVTDQERQVCELENPKILITDQKVSTLVDLVPILEEIQKSGSPFLILAEDIEGEALTTLVLNKNSGVLNVASLFEMLNWKVKIIEGTYSNMKITSPIDLKIAKLFVKNS